MGQCGPPWVDFCFASLSRHRIIAVSALLYKVKVGSWSDVCGVGSRYGQGIDVVETEGGKRKSINGGDRTLDLERVKLTS